MSDLAADSSNATPAPTPALEHALAALERRVQALESKVATLPDAHKFEEHITERVKASLPPPAPSPPPPLIDPAQPPSFKDIVLPLPNIQTIVETAKTTWTLLEMFAELRSLLWMLVDRRYTMAWLTRLLTLLLLAAILLSHLWLPLAGYDNIISRLWDKGVDLVLGLLLFMVLIFETRRYKAWQASRAR